MNREQIAEGLETAFSQRGFAEPSVPELKIASGVSLRTLYRHFPSKEAMVIGALDHRHARYLALLSQSLPAPGAEAICVLFDRLGRWMADNAPHGCMSMSAFAAFPGNVHITDSVMRHKREVRELMGSASGRPDLAAELFLLHEGASSAWPTQGDAAIHAAQRAARRLLGDV
ncbi:TetR/AcrR family transcriptional regulator [Halomonas litopenaei]|uniref:TetR/AcrR family transcriptional regulator n=1 Tax=Halomonas litopenaei TaxID=2109328 RepID=UPI001A8CB26F|nr:TetR/AcrR family transcriptional regulator [Halomonas litopenaei]MBN8412731.1 TetR/AcrR family transcriptional regulator [Halomonas litopenaei]